MKDAELYNERAEALYSVYKKGLEGGRFASMREASRFVSKQPAPSFFISARQAAFFIKKIIAGISLIHLSSKQRDKIWCLYDCYTQWVSDHKDKASTLTCERIMEELVDQPAPEFYMSSEAVRRILQKKTREARRAFGW